MTEPIDILREAKIKIKNGPEITGLWSGFAGWDDRDVKDAAWDFVRRVGGHSGGWVQSEAMRIINRAIALALFEEAKRVMHGSKFPGMSLEAALCTIPMTRNEQDNVREEATR